jgi:hypothetical protein
MYRHCVCLVLTRVIPQDRETPGSHTPYDNLPRVILPLLLPPEGRHDLGVGQESDALVGGLLQGGGSDALIDTTQALVANYLSRSRHHAFISIN